MMAGALETELGHDLNGRDINECIMRIGVAEFSAEIPSFSNCPS